MLQKPLISNGSTEQTAYEPLHIEETGKTLLVSNFWDCECDQNFIHRKSTTPKCEVCGTQHEDQPDSRANEILNDASHLLTALEAIEIQTQWDSRPREETDDQSTSDCLEAPYFPVEVEFPPVVMTKKAKQLLDSINAELVAFEIANALLTSSSVSEEYCTWSCEFDGKTKGKLSVDCPDEDVNVGFSTSVSIGGIDFVGTLELASEYKPLPSGKCGYVISLLEEN